jgi:hypothetical protein
MAFNLEAQDPSETLPENVRLGSLDGLIGHKIIATIDDCAGVKARGGEALIVTETGCWLVLAAGGDADSFYISVEHGRSWCGPDAISDYASADQMLHAGLITRAQRDYLRTEEQRREDERNAKRAAALRAELARLEGSK